MSKKIKPIFNLSFNKGYTPKGFDNEIFHLHIRYLDDWGELYFRDYLIDHPTIAKEYTDLKKDLLNKYNRDAYTKSKTDFIVKHTKLAKEKYRHRYFHFDQI